MAHTAVQDLFSLVRLAGLRVVAAFCVALLAGALVTFIAPTSASAKPEFAAQTGQACGACHTNPAGGGALKPLGAKFKANGNKMPK
jgi:mono/diheme cytochrome c family protein